MRCTRLVDYRRSELRGLLERQDTVLHGTRMQGQDLNSLGYFDLTSVYGVVCESRCSCTSVGCSFLAEHRHILSCLTITIRCVCSCFEQICMDLRTSEVDPPISTVLGKLLPCFRRCRRSTRAQSHPLSFVAADAISRPFSSVSFKDVCLSQTPSTSTPTRDPPEAVDKHPCSHNSADSRPSTLGKPVREINGPTNGDQRQKAKGKR